MDHKYREKKVGRWRTEPLGNSPAPERRPVNQL